jgi:CRP-like cAMP-binding protein
MAETTLHRTRNKLLDGLPVRDLKRLLPHLERDVFVPNEVLNKAGQPIEHVYFPSGGAVSILASGDGGSAIDVAMIGSEGLVGTPVLHGSEVASNDACVRTDATALRIPRRVVLDVVEDSPTLRRRFLRFAQALAFQISQNVVCATRHSVDQRCARWLLATHDRVRGKTVPYTHKALAHMLGVRRASATEAALALRRAGIIDYGRSELAIIDLRRLKSVSCGCYRAITKEYTRLIGHY